MGLRVFITGCSGYLAQTLIQACLKDPGVEWVGGIDVRAPRDVQGWHFQNLDIRSTETASVLEQNKVNTLVHMAWVFNPTHNPLREFEVDVLGSRNIVEAAAKARIPYMIYMSSTTAYGPHQDNPPIFDESYPRRGHPGYLYSKYKAEVDTIMLEFLEKHPDFRMFMIRACIILGPHTQNIVTKMTEMPIMFGVSGYDPPMQFLHEEDLQRLLVWAVKNQPTGVYNVAGRDTIRYSRLVSCIRKKALWLPPGLIYPAQSLIWKLRMMPFPPSILDFIRYPWVADTKKFESAFDFAIKHTSEEALMAYARARWPGRFGTA